MEAHMGSRMVRFNFTPEENEQIETVVKLPEEKRSMIHGIVKDHKNRVVKDAIVKLFEVTNPHKECAVKPITHTFTDECGQLMFGPLMACKHYAIKVWVNDIKIRELIIQPDDCSKSPHDNHQDHNTPPAHHKSNSDSCASCEGEEVPCFYYEDDEVDDE